MSFTVEVLNKSSCFIYGGGAVQQNDNKQEAEHKQG